MSSLPIPPSLSTDQLLYRAMEALAEGQQETDDQHVISQTLLRRFAGRQGAEYNQLCYLNIKYPKKVYLGGSDKCGKVKNFVRCGSDSLEMVWKRVEDQLPHVFQAVDDGVAISSPECIDRIKNVIALHFTRSLQTAKVSQRAVTETEEQLRLKYSSDPALLREYFRYKHRLEPAGPDALEVALEEMIRQSGERVYDGSFFRARIEDMYRRVRESFSPLSVRIATPSQGEFLIGDVPALTVRWDMKSSGVLGGVALAQANTVILPLGPRALVALGKKNELLTLSKDQVEEANRRQIHAAQNYVYFRPGSGLEKTVRAHI
ncbi:DUF4238 domain-containing protein [Streptosporangium sp. NPDC023615]|uniref:DUF4238 domain-containing protein n=1 Tax=Streptosporangium sp. NPDC023615 TaxID=3154794 RepID=UPI00342B55E1